MGDVSANSPKQGSDPAIWYQDLQGYASRTAKRRPGTREYQPSRIVGDATADVAAW